MRLIQLTGLIALILIFEGCFKNKEKSEGFLKKGTVQLAQPILSAPNTIIDDSTLLTIRPLEDGLKLYYTTDGSEPTTGSSLYEGTIKISVECIVKAKAFHPDWLPSEVSSIEFLQAGIKPVNIELLSELSEKYPGNGIKTLIDNQKGIVNLYDSNWIGVNESLSAIVDFGVPRNLHSLKVCYLTNTGAWIFPPKIITVFGSDNGKDFEKLSTKTLKMPTANTASEIRYADIALKTNSKYIKVHIDNFDKIPDWHDGKGNSAWIFMDEWIFN